MGQGGDVFVLDMGDPVRIADLATRMVHLSGQEVKSPETPDGTIEIKYVGLRPGEKLYEELLIGDNVTGTDHPLIRRAQEKELEWDTLHAMLDRMSNACERFDHQEVRRLLLTLVEEYSPAAEIEDHIWRRLAATTMTKAKVTENISESRTVEETVAE
jgi:FlaA1/EpsC-like NDP-sugar epimerase